MSEIITKKKRGRKPKNYNPIIKNETNCSTEENIITEEEKIIYHLPITMDEINNDMSNTDMSMFIKPSDINLNKSLEDSNSTESLKNTQPLSQTRCASNKSVNKITTHSLKFNSNTKCFWCRTLFNSPPVQLPEDYYNETFYCVGQ